MTGAPFHVPDPADEIAQKIAAEEFLTPQLAEIHARQHARYTPDSDRPAGEQPIIEDPDPEC